MWSTSHHHLPCQSQKTWHVTLESSHSQYISRALDAPQRSQHCHHLYTIQMTKTMQQSMMPDTYNWSVLLELLLDWLSRSPWCREISWERRKRENPNFAYRERSGSTKKKPANKLRSSRNRQEVRSESEVANWKNNMANISASIAFLKKQIMISPSNWEQSWRRIEAQQLKSSYTQGRGEMIITEWTNRWMGQGIVLTQKFWVWVHYIRFLHLLWCSIL